MPHLNAVIAVRGSAVALTFVAGWITQNVFEYDDLAHRLPEVLSLLTPTKGQGEPIDLVVAGWSGLEWREPPASSWKIAAKANSFLMVNHDRHPEAKALVAVDPGDVACMPGDPTVIAAAQAQLPKKYTNVDQLDPTKVGLAMMEAQRLIKVEVPGQFDATTAHIVGRFAQITTIHRDRIETRILKRWPDGLGHPINPAEAAA